MVFNPGSMRRTCYPDKNWKQEIPKAVRASDVVIVCFSRHSVNKAGYIQKEIKYASSPKGPFFSSLSSLRNATFRSV